MPHGIQVSNTPTLDYDPKVSLPYPYFISPDGEVQRQDFWRGTPRRLLGFQLDADVQSVDLRTRDWLAGDPEAAVGMFAVFIDDDGGMWNQTNPVSRAWS